MFRPFHFKCVSISRGEFHVFNTREIGSLRLSTGEVVVRSERGCWLSLVSETQNGSQVRTLGTFANGVHIPISLTLADVVGLMSASHILKYNEHVTHHFEKHYPIKSRSDIDVRFWGRFRNAEVMNSRWTVSGRPAFLTPETSEVDDRYYVFYLPNRIDVLKDEYESYIEKLHGFHTFDHASIMNELRRFRVSNTNTWKLYVIFLALFSQSTLARDFPARLVTSSGDGLSTLGDDEGQIVYNRLPVPDPFSWDFVLFGVGFAAIIAMIVALQRSSRS